MLHENVLELKQNDGNSFERVERVSVDFTLIRFHIAYNTIWWMDFYSNRFVCSHIFSSSSHLLFPVCHKLKAFATIELLSSTICFDSRHTLWMKTNKKPKWNWKKSKTSITTHLKYILLLGNFFFFFLLFSFFIYMDFIYLHFVSLFFMLYSFVHCVYS